MYESKSNNFNTYETLYIKICSKQAQDYIKCLDNNNDKLNACEELRNIYLFCISDKNMDKINELNLNKKKIEMVN
jgi:hypothetical protein